MVGGTKFFFCNSVLAGLLSLASSDAAAQATTNPTRASFTASPDHSLNGTGGTPLVESYEIGLYMVGATQPFQRISIGKPAPDGTGTITVDMTAAFLGWPVVGVTYVADVAALGPGGSARSPLSNTFSFTGGGACSFTVSPTSMSSPTAGGSYTANVATTSGCTWSAVSNAAWIAVTSGGSGTGSGNVGYAVAANATASARTGSLMIAGQPLTVTQSGVTVCTFTLSPSSQVAPADGGQLATNVTTGTGCTWTTVSNTSWITVTSGGSATSSGTARYTVAANRPKRTRTGTLTIAGQTVTVTQAGGDKPGKPTNMRVIETE